jgi:uncharacterized membrane protein (Fun14 family)
MKKTVEDVLCIVGVFCLSFISLSDIIINVVMVNKSMDSLTEMYCQNCLQNLNYSCMANKLVDNTKKKTSLKKLLYLSVRKGVMIIGGNSDSRKCFFFSFKLNKLINMGSLTCKRDMHDSAIVWHRGRMYVISSNFIMLYGSIEIYDPILNSWEDENKGNKMTS